MSPKIALAGASGNLGPAVLEQLLNAGFEVTVLTRENKDNKFDTRAKVAQVDYNSLESLTSALTGQDVVVNTLGAGTIPREIHLRLVDAAVAAKVQRFIPSEFGSDTANPKAAKVPVFGDKVAVQQHLKEASEKSGGTFTYTLFINGPFLDWGLKVGFLLKLAGPEAELYDGGDRKISATTLAGIGKGIAGVVRNLDATKNRTVYVREAEITQNELLRLSKKELPTKVVTTDQLEADAFAELQKPSPNLGVFAINLIKRTIFGEGYGSLFPAENVYNDLLGVGVLSEKEVEDIVLQHS
ncbi:NAD(P)-binding protein [Aspergillus steynii IBT 23096]|uniref:NAD(P)-binding protein n=1 Tax=Aspergillus steynii IBT 23096 TaxID=1392250 RepID=A0A2I2GHG7_9EURO|nr:NAD(P)-binding protein [Aspergillus steynii IBT 23096]PLB52318.1 NAD(P)-binding protein [Aspergillus steynii IBT 23096]